MKLSDMVANLPEPRFIADARGKIRKRLMTSGKYLVVVDDDPTGTQTVHNVLVYTDWSVEQLQRALASKEPVFFISTNSRSLNPKEAKALNYEVGQNLLTAAQLEKAELLLASRSDSTLRGHFPYEVAALAEGLHQKFDGIIIVPALFEAGRYTIHDIQWVDYGEKVLSAEKTEFAQDPSFGFRHGNLKKWVEEKTGGQINADDVHSVSLETIRTGGPEAVTRQLRDVTEGTPVIVNAGDYADLEVFMLGLLAAEDAGKKFIYRCAASFIKVRGGFEDKPLLTGQDLNVKKGPGLIVVGSYVEKTTWQINRLREKLPVIGIELGVRELLNAYSREREINRVLIETEQYMRQDMTVIVYSSREKWAGAAETFLQAGSTIMAGLCTLVQRLSVRPTFFISKGGITSIEIAKTGLGVKKARVLGQISPGVPVWKLSNECRFPDIPYIVFPGNVGTDTTLLEIVDSLVKGG